MSKMLEKENGNVILRVILFMGDKIAKGELLYALLLYSYIVNGNCRFRADALR